MKNTFRKILWAFIALVLVQAACISPIKRNPDNFLRIPGTFSLMP